MKTLIITPSRGRAEQLGEMLKAAFGTSEADTSFAVAIDSDDPDMAAYQRVLFPWLQTNKVMLYQGDRRTFSEWTNQIAMFNAHAYDAMGSFGDDHFPRTHGWDAKLAGTIEKAGGSGIASGNDLFQTPRLPTAPVITTDIILALGWFCQPTMAHYFVDNVWYDLVEGLVLYREDVIIEHVHWAPGKAPGDLTYAQAQQAHWSADMTAYDHWCQEHRADDIKTVRAVVSK